MDKEQEEDKVWWEMIDDDDDDGESKSIRDIPSIAFPSSCSEFYLCSPSGPRVSPPRALSAFPSLPPPTVDELLQSCRIFFT